jgi:hypothetical protein
MLVKVSWLDAFSTNEEIELSNPGFRLPEVHTVGWLLSDNYRYVLVSAERILHSDRITYRGHTIIPQSIVTEVKAL